MSIYTRVLLLVSVAVFAIAIAVILKLFFAVDATPAFAAAGFIFLTGWQFLGLLDGWRKDILIDEQLANLEDSGQLLRMDLERLRRTVDRQSESGGAENKSELTSELKLLHTLLGQVMRKQNELMESAEQRAAEVETMAAAPVEDLAVGEAPLAEALAHGAPASPVEDAESDVADPAEQDVTPADRDQMFDSESESVTGVRSPAASLARGSAQIRLIQDEERLAAVIRNSLSENRVDLYLQPTMKMPGRQIVHFECFSRVRDEDGNVLLPRQYIAAAEHLSLAGTLDNLLLFRLIQLLRRLGARQPNMRFFCNLSRQSLEDDEFFPQFADFMMSNSEFVNRLVFEITQEDEVRLSQAVTDRLVSLGRRGFAFCLDRVNNIDTLNLKELEAHHYRYIKMDWKVLHDAYGADGIGYLVQSLRTHSLQLIGSQIETETEALNAAETALELAQGYAFGEPQPAQQFARDL